MTSFSKFLKESQFTRIAALVLLLILLGIGAIPGYLKGRWQWQEPPPVVKLKEIKSLRKTGLKLPGWQTLEQREQNIGEHKWSFQVIQQQSETTQVLVLLMPQNGPRDQPAVEWTDIDSFWRWKVAQYRPVEFTVKGLPGSGRNSPTKVKARFFRGVSKQQTFAVLQWYALPNGGNPSPLNWFLADQRAQWRQQRVPWVAVSIILPMEPLGQVEKYWDDIQSVGKAVQGALMEIFQ
ncbi:MAG: cyanoexosortase B system-associated protein [Nostocaceae cyanobacterium]|nr:cyanoexosortase B system-associated protein [Nostocaceae cyanobacterium]